MEVDVRTAAVCHTNSGHAMLSEQAAAQHAWAIEMRRKFSPAGMVHQDGAINQVRICSKHAMVFLAHAHSMNPRTR